MAKLTELQHIFDELQDREMRRVTLENRLQGMEPDELKRFLLAVVDDDQRLDDLVGLLHGL